MRTKRRFKHDLVYPHLIFPRLGRLHAFALRFDWFVALLTLFFVIGQMLLPWFVWLMRKTSMEVDHVQKKKKPVWIIAEIGPVYTLRFVGPARILITRILIFNFD